MLPWGRVCDRWALCMLRQHKQSEHCPRSTERVHRGPAKTNKKMTSSFGGLLGQAW